jgi:hypothetical protein
MKVICINDKNKPNEIPSSHWVKEGKEYTVVWAARLDIQGIWGVKLAEIDLSAFVPWTFFNSDRFIPLDDLPINELLEELELETEK